MPWLYPNLQDQTLAFVGGLFDLALKAIRSFSLYLKLIVLVTEEQECQPQTGDPPESSPCN